MKNDLKKQEGWVLRLVFAICEKISNWILSRESSVSPDDGLMFMTYHSLGWEDAMMAQAMVRFKQIKDEVA